jgi:predicted RNA-binding Zn ribbon-like protein
MGRVGSATGSRRRGSKTHRRFFGTCGTGSSGIRTTEESRERVTLAQSAPIEWLEQANAIAPDVAARFRRSNDQRALDRVAGWAREFRDWLRGFVTRHMGKSLTTGAAKALGPPNELLAGDTSYPVVEAAGGEQALRLRRVRRWEGPDELLLPIAEAAADLVCSVDLRLIRACEGFPCTLVFLDRTKAHIRRWCSMAACGNRAKAAAHRARKRSK